VSLHCYRVCQADKKFKGELNLQFWNGGELQFQKKETVDDEKFNWLKLVPDC